MKVLFVCLGNICRSPMAEAVFNQLCRNQQLPYSAASCGTSGQHSGEDPDERTLKMAARHGIPIQHKARRFNTGDWENYDVIIPMDASNKKDLMGWQGASAAHLLKIKQAGAWANPPYGDMPDPWYGDLEGFEETVDLSMKTCEGLIRWLIHTKRSEGWVKGRVQGVSFRASARQEAQRLGLSGWVQNRTNNEVAFAVQGNAKDVEQFHHWVAKGPALARVDTYDWKAIPPLAAEDTFTVLT